MSRVVLAFNPISGAGRAEEIAGEHSRWLQAAGYEPEIVATSPVEGTERLDRLLRDADALVVYGGDGAVRWASGPASSSGTAIYQVPLGTENLFAREFGMDRRPEALVRSLDAGRIQRVDMGMADAQPFLLMVSVGFDADVVHDLASRRAGSISHLSYLPPVARQLWRWRPRPLRVTVDGQRIDDDRTGFVVVANCRQYGLRLDPARAASMDDGQLDVVFFPSRTRLDLIGWATKCRLGRHLRDSRLIYRVGRVVEIEGDGPLRFQVDGDAPVLPGQAPVPVEVLRVSVRPGALPVLLPAGSN